MESHVGRSTRVAREKSASCFLRPNSTARAAGSASGGRVSQEHIDEITRLFGDCEEASKDEVSVSRLFKNEDFGYRTITVERPKRDEAGEIVKATKGETEGKAAT